MSVSTLTMDLHRESIRARSGTGVVSLVAIISMTVGATIAFLVAGGTRMFWVRAQHPEVAAPAIKEIMESRGIGLDVWFFLALTACCFLVPALFNLTAQAAVLGASGRERRLATLRLLGLSSREVTRMTVIETGVQAVIGTTLGAALSLLLSPLFTRLSFQERPVRLEELILPWWMYLAVGAVLVVLALAAAFVGMQRVRTTPLGVARRQMPAAVKRWRAVIFVVVLVVSVVALRRIDVSAELGVMIGLVGFLGLMVMSVFLVGPFVLQLGARLVGKIPGTAHFLATQRIAADAKSVWRRVAAMAFFGFLAGYLVSLPMGNDGLTLALKEDATVSAIFLDTSTGAILTLIFGFTLAGMSIFMGQVSGVYEKAELLRSLDLMGVPRRFMTRASLLEVMGPVIAVSLLGFALGGLMAFAIFFNGAAGDIDVLERLLTAASFLGIGWALTLVAMACVEPLRRRVLADGRRKE